MIRKAASSFAVIAFVLAVGAPVTESVALAAQKSCNCKKTTVRRKRAVRSARVVKRASPKTTAPKATAQVVGPVLATYILPENQTFRLRIDDAISSSTARVGDRFRSTVLIPVHASGVEVVPAGSAVEGRIAAVRAARSRGRAGEIAVVFDALVLPDGTRHQIEGALTDLRDEDSGEVDSESHVTGRSSETRQIIFVGGGTGGGAAIGGAVGGGKGAAIGAAIGAGAGVVGAMMSKGNEVEVRRGTEIGMITLRPVTFTVESAR